MIVLLLAAVAVLGFVVARPKREPYTPPPTGRQGLDGFIEYIERERRKHK